MSDETTFDFALYLGTTTPLTITGATASTVSELSERLKSGDGFGRDHDNGAGSIMDHHHGSSSFHLQWSSSKEHIGADMQEFGKLVYLIRAENDSATAFLRDRGP